MAATIISFPNSPLAVIASLVRDNPALDALAAKLPSSDDPSYLPRARVMAEVMKLALYRLELTSGQAAAALAHDGPSAAAASEELERLLADEKTEGLYYVWSAVWESCDDALAEDARYYVAMLARLYRLEYPIRRQAGQAAAQTGA